MEKFDFEKHFYCKDLPKQLVINRYLDIINTDANTDTDSDTYRLTDIIDDDLIEVLIKYYDEVQIGNVKFYSLKTEYRLKNNIAFGIAQLDINNLPKKIIKNVSDYTLSFISNDIHKFNTNINIKVPENWFILGKYYSIDRHESNSNIEVYRLIEKEKEKEIISVNKKDNIDDELERRKKLFLDSVHYYFFEVYGLNDLELFVEPQIKNKSRASAYWHTIHDASKMVTICYSLEWLSEPSLKDYEIEKCAFHEVWEVILHELHECALSRFVTEREIIAATHQIIRRVENTIFTPKISNKSYENYF